MSTDSPVEIVVTDAENKAADADMALQELGTDMLGMAYVTATITVWDEDVRRADEKTRLVEKIIRSRDFSVMVETVNAVDAWLGSLPGHAYANVRQPPVSTLNLAHMVPSSAVWAGPERDDHFGAPPSLIRQVEPLREGQRRFQEMGEAAANDAECLAIWAETRDRFLGRSPAQTALGPHGER